MLVSQLFQLPDLGRIKEMSEDLHSCREEAGPIGTRPRIQLPLDDVAAEATQPQDQHRHGHPELPDAADERETAVGPLTGLQRDPAAHGAGRLQRQRGPTQPELQAHLAAVDGVGSARTFQRERSPAAVHVDRSMQGRSSARAYRATNAKATAQTLGACRAWGSSAAKRPQRSIFYRLFVL